MHASLALSSLLRVWHKPNSHNNKPIYNTLLLDFNICENPKLTHWYPSPKKKCHYFCTGVYNWLATNKLSLNIDKTKCVVMRAINKNVNHIPDYLTIKDTNIGREKSFNLLGVVIDEHLNWKSHTDKIANKISKNIGVLNKFKHYLPMQTLRTLYCSMIQTHLNYGNLARGIEYNRLNKLQKRAIRTICLSKYNDHTEGLFKERKLLKFPDLVLLNSLKLFYKYKHKTLPEYLSLFNFTSNADQHDHDTRHGDIIPANVTRIQQTQICIQ